MSEVSLINGHTDDDKVCCTCKYNGNKEEMPCISCYRGSNWEVDRK